MPNRLGMARLPREVLQVPHSTRALPISARPPRLQAASIDELELWLDRALDADSLAGVFAQ